MSLSLNLFKNIFFDEEDYNTTLSATIIKKTIKTPLT